MFVIISEQCLLLLRDGRGQGRGRVGRENVPLKDKSKVRGDF